MDLSPSTSTLNHPLNHDWQLAFQRSEMLRQFKTEFLASIAHELRSPLTGQLGSLEMIRANLCDSIEEAQSFVEAAHDAMQRYVLLLEECVAISRYDIPILPLQLKPLPLAPICQSVQRVTRLQVLDRGLACHWPTVTAWVTSDPHALEQVCLGLVSLSLKQLMYGSLTITAQPLTATGQLQLSFHCTGRLAASAPLTESQIWQVTSALMTQLQGQLVLVPDEAARGLTITCTFPLAEPHHECPPPNPTP